MSRMGLTVEDWEKAEGCLCTGCGQETMRIVDQLCPSCWQEKRSKDEERGAKKAEKRYYMKGLREGTISLADLREGRL